jgi:hypothetical protein
MPARYWRVAARRLKRIPDDEFLPWAGWVFDSAQAPSPEECYQHCPVRYYAWCEENKGSLAITSVVEIRQYEFETFTTMEDVD